VLAFPSGPKNELPCCPVCNSSQIGDRWPAWRINGEKTILWCAACGFGWQHPLPTPEEIRYYYDKYPTYNIHGVNEKETSSLKRIGRINQLVPSRGRLLDIGSGLGSFLKVAQEDGWDAVGIEPQKSAALHCRSQLGATVHFGTIENCNFEKESFDVVTLWDVWEHVHDPLIFLDNCVSLLSPGGVLALSVPNTSGLPARIFKGQWRYVMKTHLNYFTLSFVQRTTVDRGLPIERTNHTIKIQSLLQGFASWLPFQINTEHIIRMGRTDSMEQGRPEQGNTDEKLEKIPVLTKFLKLTRQAALKINLASLPFQYGDLMELYCRNRPRTSIFYKTENSGQKIQK
jgi:2-polyprenyl-3-methyl-5-hydroxy-6-metoxy-1,4-benzoquinol methylase